ncbi:MAG TPA: DUF4105 domain-containing protein [Verrucomicrobiae bacterium]
MRKRALWSCATLLVLAWFLTLRPSHTRNWKPEVAVLPSIQIEGDRARITGYRDFNYRSRDGFDARYQEREVDLSRLNSIDLFISYWKDGPMAHTFLSFGFENAGPVCVSIEARPEVGERFGALPGLLKAFELFYVVGTERDLVRLRTNHRNERVYRYRLNVSPADARRLFEVYVAQINRLADKPEFYHLLRNNCTMNIIRNAEIAGRKAPFDGRSILNGRIDRYLYEVGLVERTASFDELRAHAEITKAAQKAGDETFSQEIRAKE